MASVLCPGISQATGIITALNFIGTLVTQFYIIGTSTVDISIGGGGN